MGQDPSLRYHVLSNECEDARHLHLMRYHVRRYRQIREQSYPRTVCIRSHLFDVAFSQNVKPPAGVFLAR